MRLLVRVRQVILIFPDTSFHGERAASLTHRRVCQGRGAEMGEGTNRSVRMGSMTGSTERMISWDTESFGICRSSHWEVD